VGEANSASSSTHAQFRSLSTCTSSRDKISQAEQPNVCRVKGHHATLLRVRLPKPGDEASENGGRAITHSTRMARCNVYICVGVPHNCGNRIQWFKYPYLPPYDTHGSRQSPIQVL